MNAVRKNHWNKRLAKKIARELVENAFDIPAENAFDCLEDMAGENNGPLAKAAVAQLELDECDDGFWSLRNELDVLITRARKAALQSLGKYTTA